MAAGDVSRLPADAAHAPGLHPHLVALAKWCASCLWSAAALLLRRLLALPPVAGAAVPPVAALIRSSLRPRTARRRARSPRPAPHISALAAVECRVLRAPPAAAVDVVFVHGLYGSLANTWRQGQWRSKRNSELNKIPLKRPATEPPTPCSCAQRDASVLPDLKRPKNDESCICIDEKGDEIDKTRKYNIFRNQNEVIAQEKEGLNETGFSKSKYFNETLKDRQNDVNAQGRRTKDIKRVNETQINYECNKEEKYLNNAYQENEDKYILNNVSIVENYDNIMNNIFTNDLGKDFAIFRNGCDDIDMIISSINNDGANSEFEIESGDGSCDIKYDTKDQVNIKNKLNDKASSKQHEKLKFNGDLRETAEVNLIKTNNDIKDNNEKRSNKDEIYESTEVNDESRRICEVGCGCVCSRCYSSCWPRDWLQVDYPDARIISINYTSDPYLWRPIWIKESKRLRLHERAEQMVQQLLALEVGSRPVVWVGHSKGGLFIKQIYSEAYEAYKKRSAPATEGVDRSCLWSRTAGFMFYSVPHRGSPLADINIPPLVARSIELLEMGKDCSEVLGLQERWLRAVGAAGAGGGVTPVVRSLVETRRTLMAVLWLRIVSVESADAGVGALWGVSLDHREICKPSGRACPLYRELLQVIDAALGRAERPLGAHALQCRCH